MPPKRGIVKSGNAGNSKSSQASIPVPATDLNALFPPGSKYPLSLLHERCQKNGWEKAVIDTRRQEGGYAFSVTLAMLNKKTSERQTVRLEPHPPYIRPTPIEARHWGATYALYRFCNSLQLNRVLPPGPREYWNELVAEHKDVPEHMKWMYEADPFAARAAVEARQAKSAHKRETIAAASTDTRKSTPLSGEYAQAPEVRMGSNLRELVEDAIKKAIALYPEAADMAPSVLSEEDAPKVIQQLGLLGFTAVQSRNAISFLSQPSPLTSSLLESLAPLEASVEYLILHIAECDLPQRFLPSNNSSNPFITSGHSGHDDLKKRWIQEKATKVAGFPAAAVTRCTSDDRLIQSWELLVSALGQKLIGEDIETVFTAPDTQTMIIDEDEVSALGAHFTSPQELVMPLFSAPIQLHILISPNRNYTITGPPIFITSAEAAPYVRLHLLSRLLQEIKAETLIENGESFCMAAMRVLEEAWASIEDNGPPDMYDVLRHIVPRSNENPSIPDTDETETPNTRGRNKGGKPRRDPRSDAQIKQEFETVCNSKKYSEVYSARQRLPAFTARTQFLNYLSQNRVVVVVGETGCGKTTQLPQFILDSLITENRGSTASIIVTQPRRISAISVATRVASERLENIGEGSVGYAIRGESKTNAKTKLLFCTTGVVLRRLGSGDSLKDVSHVIVDEVHERSVDGDFLLLELKELLHRHPTLKVILMSATINHETFVKYFNNAPLLTIPGFTHPVTDVYLEDFVSLVKYRPQASRTGKRESEAAQQAFRDEYRSQGLDEQSITALQNITRSDRIDYQLIGSLVEYIVTSGKKKGGVLIFLPGVQEIRQCIDAVRNVLSVHKVDADVFPLHANLSNDEQRRVFAKTEKWKIIAATNVAETSITIDDVIYVVDAGKVKETQYDPDTGLSRLVEDWITRAAGRQRRGRSGRSQPGICYKLYTKKMENNMIKFPVPEILRVPLESISLTVKVMREEEDVKLFLNRAIDPPKVFAMEKAWSVLEDLGAVDLNGRLTSMGRHMSMLPVDLRLAKMLVLGTIFQCLGPVLTVAACLSSKPLFLNPMDKRDEASKARAQFTVATSDLLTDASAFDACERLRAEGKGQSFIRHFCEENFISATTVRDIANLRHDFISSLCDLGFIPFSSTPSTPKLNTNSNNTNLVKAVILGGLWPRVARVHLPKSAIKFDQLQAGTVQRENTAKEFKIYDLREGRVFLHPGSILFGASVWKSPFLVYFHKHMSSKVFLRDATEVPLYSMLLFGGPVTVNPIAGGLTIGSRESWIKLKAWPRIGILVNQLRRLLDVQLQRCIEEGSMLGSGPENPVLNAMLKLLVNDGLSE